MSTDWKALCAELAAELERCRPLAEVPDCLARARAALAAEADGPAVPEGREPASVVGEPSDAELLELAAAEMDNSPNWEEPEYSYEAGDPFPYEAPGVAWVNYARAVLARYGHQPAPPAEGEGLTDKELFRIASDCQALYIADDVDYDNCSEVVAAMRAAIAADRARYSHQPAPPAAGEAGELVEGLKLISDGMDALGHESDSWFVARAADLLEQRHPTPVPVSERLPGPGDCDAEGRCWWWDPFRRESWEYCITGGGPDWYWLPATALPLPQGEVQ